MLYPYESYNKDGIFSKGQQWAVIPKDFLFCRSKENSVCMSVNILLPSLSGQLLILGHTV